MREYDDAALELRLRGVLREHLGALPLDLTVDALDRRREVRDAARRRRRGLIALGLAAALIVPLGVLAGGGRMLLDAFVVPARSASPDRSATPETSAGVPSTQPSVSAPSPTLVAQGPWLTSRELMDRLSADYGYEWSRVAADANVVRFDSGSISVFPPIDGPASVQINGGVETATELAEYTARVAQALAPDAEQWLRDSLAQRVAAIGSPAVEEGTAAGGFVGVDVRDDPYGDTVSVWFSYPRPAGWNEPNGTGLVVTARDGLLWAVNGDGTGAGPLLRGDADPRRRTATKVDRVLGWSPDGARLFYQDKAGSVLWTDVAGSEPVLVVRGLPGEALLSPDGTRLAYRVDGKRGHYTIDVMDVANGQVTRLAFATETGDPGCAGPFGSDDLELSPDRTGVVFGNSVGPRVGGWCQGAIYASHVDDARPRRLNPPTLHAMEPRWSADGSTIFFTSSKPRSAWDHTGDATRIKVDRDIYSVRPDGSGLTALTSDGVSDLVRSSTRDGRILFVRPTGAQDANELWMMDTDGANATRLETSVSAMTAAGCQVCPDPDEAPGFDPRLAFWQPMPGDRP